MARYVIVEFDDDDKADDFVVKINGALGRVQTNEGRRFRVRWMFQKPRKFCQCTGFGGRAGKDFRSQRGEKFGWWVHEDCGRPKKTNYQNPRNLLDPDAPNPTGWMFMGLHVLLEEGQSF